MKYLTYREGQIASVKHGARGGWWIEDTEGVRYRTFSAELAKTARDLFFREVPVRFHFDRGWLHRDLLRLEPILVEVRS